MKRYERDNSYEAARHVMGQDVIDACEKSSVSWPSLMQMVAIEAFLEREEYESWHIKQIRDEMIRLGY